jgi:RNA polymerase sigma factor (TIGR02999 family)
MKTQARTDDQFTADQLLPLVYDDLRHLAASKMQAERPDLTIQATALVHEAYLRLTRGNLSAGWNDRGEFLAAFAESMRRVLIDCARRHQALKRGASGHRLPLDAVVLSEDSADDLLALDDALQRLAELHPQKANVVRLRYFAGLTVRETAEALGISERTTDRDWAYARAWLLRELEGASAAPSDAES